MTRIRASIAMLLCLVPAMAGAGGGVPFVSEHRLARQWLPLGDPAAAPVAIPAPPGADACVSIGYLIDAGGAPGMFTLLRTWSSRPLDTATIDGFAVTARDALSTRRFRAVGRPAAVFTAATYGVGASGAPAEESVLAHCRIGNLQAFVQQRARQTQASRLDRLRDERRTEEFLGCTSFSSACVVANDERR